MKTYRLDIGGHCVGGACGKRFRKDILPVGRRMVNGELWDVTRQTLLDIVSNFRRARGAGCDCPVVWDQSNDVRHRAGKVLDLEIKGDTLTALFSVADPADAAMVDGLSGAFPEIVEPFVDGRGNTYPIALKHLSLPRPRVTSGQGTVQRLSLQPQPKGISPMARNGITKTVRISQAGIARIGNVRRMAGTAVSSDPMALNVAQVREWVNLLLTSNGREDLLLPESVMDAASFTNRMEGIVQSIQASIDEENSGEASASDAPSMALATKSSGKQRQLGKKKLGYAEAIERGRRFATRGY